MYLRELILLMPRVVSSCEGFDRCDFWPSAPPNLTRSIDSRIRLIHSF